jgi:hypothetical protein
LGRLSLGKRINMTVMRRSVKQKVVGAAAVAALLAAGSIAAVSATGQGNPPRHRHSHEHRAHRARAHDLAVAAGYLGVSSTQLSSELAAGKTLAQIADATSGKSAAGLTEALLAAHRAKLATAGAKLPQRVAAELARAGGPGGARAGKHRRSAGERIGALFASARGPGAVAARYLGVAPAELQSDLRSGKTLAQVAAATPSKSQAGLVAALESARRARFAAAASAGRVPASREAKRLARLHKRVEALVQRSFAGAGSP